ncbi:MAG: Gfo/Idh/MocA family oxidoreductase, partial [Calditrichaeota bacterium]|nr:Gfo/Idh/MocA family oxidoreductase [Calditrichota bacterium]
MKKVNRREFIKTSAAVAAGVSLLPSGIILGRDDRKVRLGFIGVGLRGTSHLELALARKDVEVKAVCDIRKAATDNAVKLVTDAGQKKPAVYLNGEEDYRNLVTREDIDGVIISTPWVWHAPMAIAAMKAGKYAGVEVPAALTEEECWDLVHTSEETGMPCMILENVCYRRDVMAVYNMVRQGIFGELMHCHCGYQHDLRGIKFQPGAEFGEKGQGEAVWRTEHSIK